MQNQKSLTLASGQTIPDQFNAFFAHQFPKSYIPKRRHNPTIKDVPASLIQEMKRANDYKADGLSRPFL